MNPWDQELADTIEAEHIRRRTRRCYYCGARCYGFTCQAHTHLPRLDPHLDPLSAAPDPSPGVAESGPAVNGAWASASPLNLSGPETPPSPGVTQPQDDLRLQPGPERT